LSISSKSWIAGHTTAAALHSLDIEACSTCTHRGVEEVSGEGGAAAPSAVDDAWTAGIVIRSTMPDGAALEAADDVS
jgi:hypothetical protein